MIQSHYYKLIVTKYLNSKNDNMRKWSNVNEKWQHYEMSNLNDKITEQHRKNNVISQLHSYSNKMPQTKNDSMMNFKRLN